MNFSRFDIISSGVQPQTPFEDALRTRMVNILVLLVTFCSLTYLVVYEGLFFFLNVGFIAGFAATWIFNKIGWNYFAKVWLYTLIHIALFISASAFGREAGEQLILIPVLFGGILVFSRERQTMVFAITLTVTTFILLEITNYSMISLPISPETRLSYYYGNLAVTIISSAGVALLYIGLYNKQIRRTQEMLSISEDIENTINYFSTSLFGQNTVEEILWDVAKNCISKLNFEDCVIYLLDNKKKILMQKAAFGEKNPTAFNIKNPIEIPVGHGIVGHVAYTEKSMRVADTTTNTRYIQDDRFRYSELAVPLIYNDQVIGVIDSEHSAKNFFTDGHERILQTIAALCANKIVRAQAEEDKEKARQLHMEAEKIKAIDDLKTILLTNLSHELRTPLTLIMGTIDKHRFSTDAEDWGIVKSHANRLLRLINQLMDLTLLESGQFTLTPRPQDINAFFRMSVSIFASTASSQGVSIEYQEMKDPLHLNFDWDALEKIFFNILSNAVKFTKDHSTISIKVAHTDGLLNVEVSDQGPGIADSVKEEIFERFYRTHQQKPGIGIGLAITKELVDLHGGTISVNSVFGRGSTFHVCLPLETATIPLRAHTAKVDSPGSMHCNDLHPGDKPLILVVEDQEEVSDLIVNLLQSDYQIVQCYNGLTGFKRATELLPELIISDIMMSGKDGLELCRDIRASELTNHIPIILLTAKADMKSKLEGLDTGADDYIVKPFHPEELLGRVENLLLQRRLLQEKYKNIIELRPGSIPIASEGEILIQKMLEIVENHMADGNFSVQFMAQELNMSRMQLHRKVTALIGQSANEFIRDIRLQRAAQLLKQGEMVSQTAYSVGYSSLSNFSRIFKEKYGVLPSEYGLE